MDLRNIIDTALDRIPCASELPAAFGDLILVRSQFRAEFLSDHTRRSREDFVMVGDVHAYVTAMLELHFEPGVNPHHKHSRVTTEPVWKIWLSRLKNPQVLWHTTPGLHAGRPGAGVIGWQHGECIWRHPDCVRYETAHECNNDREEDFQKRLPVCVACHGLKEDDGKHHLPKEARCICPATESVAATSS